MGGEVGDHGPAAKPRNKDFARQCGGQRHSAAAEEDHRAVAASRENVSEGNTTHADRVNGNFGDVVRNKLSEGRRKAAAIESKEGDGKRQAGGEVVSRVVVLNLVEELHVVERVIVLVGEGNEGEFDRRRSRRVGEDCRGGGAGVRKPKHRPGQNAPPDGTNKSAESVFKTVL